MPYISYMSHTTHSFLLTDMFCGCATDPSKQTSSATLFDVLINHWCCPWQMGFQFVEISN